MAMAKVLPFRRKYFGCDICFMDYDEPKSSAICWECQQRCVICSASFRRCENPSVFALSLQAKNFTRLMNIHKQAGDELWWFDAMDTTNEDTNEQVSRHSNSSSSSVL